MVNLSNGTPVSHAGEDDVFRKETYLWLDIGFFQLFFHCWIVGTYCLYVIYLHSNYDYNIYVFIMYTVPILSQIQPNYTYLLFQQL